MAAITALIALGSLAVAGASYVSAEKSRKQAQAAYQSQAAEATKARSEQVAMNTQAAANERRQQVREERVRRAKIMQASENTGTADSSGMFGATSGLATQLGANLGTSFGMEAAAGRISSYNQNAADFGTTAQRNLNSAASASNMFNLSMSIFNSAGGFGNFSTPKAT